MPYKAYHGFIGFRGSVYGFKSMVCTPSYMVLKQAL